MEASKAFLIMIYREIEKGKSISQIARYANLPEQKISDLYKEAKDLIQVQGIRVFTKDELQQVLKLINEGKGVNAVISLLKCSRDLAYDAMAEARGKGEKLNRHPVLKVPQKREMVVHKLIRQTEEKPFERVKGVYSNPQWHEIYK